MAGFRTDGTFTALVTPFQEAGDRLDLPALEALVEAQLTGGVDVLVPCGTTGETPTLTDAEQEEVIRVTARVAAGRAPILAGTGSNSTEKTIHYSRAALRAGADAVMVVMPYYNKPSQEGMRQHLAAVHDAIEAPVVLYNIPGRTGVELSVESLLWVLDRCPRVVAVKDATGNVLHAQELLRRAGDRVSVLSGDDPLTLPLMSLGARGVVSVTSNVLPGAVARLVGAAREGRWEEARRRHLALLPLHRALFLEPNPQPVKAALAARGVCKDAVRLPLVRAGEATRRELQAALEALGSDAA